MTRILIIAHAFYNRGGVEVHLASLTKALRKQCDFLILFPDDNSLVARRGDAEVRRWPSTAISIVSPERSSPHEQVLQEAIRDFNPQIIHLAHPLGWPLSLVSDIIASGIPYIVSLHDYFFISPIFTFEGKTGEETISSAFANAVFGHDISPYLVARREIFARLLQGAAERIVPSAYLEQIITRTFPLACTIIPYGIELFSPPPHTPQSPPRFGFLGSLLPQKGWDLLIGPFNRITRDHPKVELHIYGGNRPPSCPAHPQILFHGPFMQESLISIVGTFDIGIIPSRFSETYSIVLSELWQGKKAVMVAERGALAERVRDGINGKTFKADNSEDLERVARWYIENQEWRTWEVPKPFAVEEMATRYATIYNQITSS
jgi:glycosyltransferase involved in cell wall biosynthesis